MADTTAVFDVDAARKSGASDDQILDYLSKRSPDFDVQSALKQTPKDQVIQYLAKNAKAPDHVVKAAPKEWSVPWLKEKLYNIADSLTEALPAAGATAGAMIGGGGGTLAEPGGGTAVGAVGGAGIGGMAGEALKQHVRRALGFEDVPQTSEDAAKEITKEGVIQGGTQAVAEALPVAAGPLRKAAAKQYERALAPTTAENKAITKKVLPEMMDRGVHGSLEGIEKQAESSAADLRPKIDAAIDAIPESELNAFLERYNVPAVAGGTTDEIKAALAAKHAQSHIGSMASTVPGRVLAPENKIVDEIGSQASTIPDSVFGARKGTKLVIDKTAGPTSGAGSKVLDDLESLKQSYMLNGKPADDKAVAAISGVQDVVKRFGDDIDAKSLRKLRQIFDTPVAKAKGFTTNDLATSYELEAKKAAGDSIRGILSEASPDVAKLNKEMSFWLNVQKVARDSGLRRTGQEGGLVRVLGPLAAAGTAGAGFASHGAETSIEAAGLTAALSAVALASRTPQWRTIGALFKDRLADALASGSAGRVFALTSRLGISTQEATKESRKGDQTEEQ